MEVVYIYRSEISIHYFKKASAPIAREMPLLNMVSTTNTGCQIDEGQCVTPFLASMEDRIGGCVHRLWSIAIEGGITPEFSEARSRGRR